MAKTEKGIPSPKMRTCVDRYVGMFCFVEKRAQLKKQLDDRFSVIVDASLSHDYDSRN